MATTSTVPWYSSHEQPVRACSSSAMSGNRVSATTTYLPSNFPDNFQDFFATLNEDLDDLPNMLEDKLIPRSGCRKESDSSSDALANSNMNKQARWAKRAFQRRSSEVEVRLQASSANGPKSPAPSRRRSSSIAVARPTPDLHRFLQAEASPWGHLSPSPRSPTRTPALSPGGAQLSAGTSPVGPSPATSPAAPANPAATGASRLPPQPKHRGRTSSMPAVPRHRPMLAETRRGIGSGNASGANGEDEHEEGVEYYRLRSFSITANGVFNLGDSLKSRRSRSINSVTSSGTSCSSTRDASSASQLSGIEVEQEAGGESSSSSRVPTYRVGMLGASGVGKTALTAQFTTSEYICAYDASLDDEYGQKSVSVMIDGQETELEIIDHPTTEMSVETFCSTYNPDVYVVVYSVVDRRSLKFAEETLLHLWKSDYMAKHGVILVGNKVDLERKREVPAIMGRRIANSCGCKFIETSSGLAHHVDELLVGILAQIKLNPQRDRDQVTRRRRSKHRRKILKHLLGFKRKTKSCENLFVI
ncbi:uncharacterized protein LOC131665185 isoform X2 [Phymastichus coffea]|uniref:uncharacterized protein LOC131665185 isoform X2 n=1 Tax=Phymastichus coffea TaxID=108790 RepID=UPI00273C22FF|nr:uncharacterized protein LOC131665185 isoform X2 [Phymastichus coffea]